MLKRVNHSSIVALLSAALILTCKDEETPLQLPTTPQLLTPDSGKDEDPTVLQAHDGSFYIAWFSDRDSNPEIYMTHSVDGIKWESPWKIIADPAEDLYPQLHESKNGGFYLTWFRIAFDVNLQQFTFHVWFAKSTDGKVWTNHQQLSEASSTFNWVPTILEDSDGRIQIVYTSGRLDLNKEIYLIYSDDEGSSWSAPQRLTTNSLSDDFPFIMQSKAGTYFLTWTRYDETLGAFNPTMENLLITSPDGITWSNPQEVSPPDPSSTITDTLPHLYTDGEGTGVFIAWTSDRSGNGGNIFSASLSTAGTNAGLIARTSNGKAYSGRIIPTTLGKHLMVWVSTENSTTQPDIFYQFVD